MYWSIMVLISVPTGDRRLAQLGSASSQKSVYPSLIDIYRNEEGRRIVELATEVRWQETSLRYGEQLSSGPAFVNLDAFAAVAFSCTPTIGVEINVGGVRRQPHVGFEPVFSAIEAFPDALIICTEI